MHTLYARYTQHLIDLWRQYYPGYEENLRALSPQARQEHFRRVYVAWSCEHLAWELAKAELMRFPFRNPFWLDHMLALGVPIELIAEQSRVPAAVVRYYAWKFHIVRPGGLWQTLAWIVAGRTKEPLAPAQTMPPIQAQARWENIIFVQPRGKRIFFPVEECLVQTEG